MDSIDGYSWAVLGAKPLVSYSQQLLLVPCAVNQRMAF